MRDGLGAAWLDVSTGLFETAALAEAELLALLGRLDPAEILAPTTLPLADWSNRRAPETVPSPPLVARRRLAEAFGAASLDAFGSFTDAEAVAAALALDYVRATQVGALPRLARPTPQGRAGTLAMDAATRASLEILRTRDGTERHTLFAAVKRTLTAAGARTLAAMAVRPPHRHRRDRRAPGRLVLAAGQPAATTALRTALRAAPDIARALARLSLGRGGPRDLAALRDGHAPPPPNAAAALDGPLPAALTTARAALAIDPALQRTADRRAGRSGTAPTGRRRRHQARFRRRTRRRARAARRQPQGHRPVPARLCATLRRWHR